jgi:hypothetical protein
MAFRKQTKGTERTTWAPVVVDGFSKDGKRVKQDFKAKFLIPEQSEINTLIGVDADNINDEKIIQAVLKDWSEVEDENGDPLPFTTENVADIMEEYPTRPTVVRTWLGLIGKLGGRKN